MNRLWFVDWSFAMPFSSCDFHVHLQVDFDLRPSSLWLPAALPSRSRPSSRARSRSRGSRLPAGYISLAPDVGNGGKGAMRVLQIKDGTYDSSKEAAAGA